MLKKTNFQFYATHDEIMRFIDNVRAMHNLHIYLVRVYPEYRMLEVKHNQDYDLTQWTLALFSAHEREIGSKEAYCAYSKTIHGDLILHIGEETETELRESSIGAAQEQGINPTWVKLIDLLKKKCRKGAYMVTAQNIRKYYPQIRYSEGAREACRTGKTVRPIVGWNRVELVSEER